MSNVILIRGTGRNVGKTLIACRIIEQLADTCETVAIKISPHFHELSGPQRYIHQSEELVIVEEQHLTGKDSSRMWQAGAKRVYYIQAKDNQLKKALNLLMPSINPSNPVVVESAGLYNVLEPGLLINVVGEDTGKKITSREKTQVIQLPAEQVQDFNLNSIQFFNGKFIVNASL